jgi:Cu-Zn family superoxide dismutase
MPKFNTALILAVTGLAVTACSAESEPAPIANKANELVPGAAAHGDLIARDRSVIGSVSLTQGSAGVVIRIEASGLPVDTRGAWHGVHLHRVGDCSSEDFTSSSGHINPSMRQHGLLNEFGPDNADLTNIWVGEDGSLHAELHTTRVFLEGPDDGTLPALLDGDGSALVIHAGPDDQTSQPIGGAGARIACAVISAG